MDLRALKTKVWAHAQKFVSDTYLSVVYEERNVVPGVKFAVETHEEWTPVTKTKKVKRLLHGQRRRNPVRSKDEVLQL